LRDQRAGRNPPSVLGGIRLSRLPVSHTDLIDTYLPLHPWTGRFTVSTNMLNDLTRLIDGVGGRFVSAPVAGLSSYALQRHGSAKWAEFPQASYDTRQPPTSSPTPLKEYTKCNSKAFGKNGMIAV